MNGIGKNDWLCITCFKIIFSRDADVDFSMRIGGFLTGMFFLVFEPFVKLLDKFGYFDY